MADQDVSKPENLVPGESDEGQDVAQSTSDSEAARLTRGAVAASHSALSVQNAASLLNVSKIVHESISGPSSARMMQAAVAATDSAMAVPNAALFLNASKIVQKSISGPSAARMMQSAISGINAAKLMKGVPSGIDIAKTYQNVFSGLDAAKVVRDAVSELGVTKAMQEAISGIDVAAAYRRALSGFDLIAPIRLQVGGLEAIQSEFETQTSAEIAETFAELVADLDFSKGPEQAFADLESKAVDLRADGLRISKATRFAVAGYVGVLAVSLLTYFYLAYPAFAKAALIEAQFVPWACLLAKKVYQSLGD